MKSYIRNVSEIILATTIMLSLWVLGSLIIAEAVTSVPAPQISSVEQLSQNELKISWNKVSGCRNYVIQMKSGGKWNNIKSLSGKSFTVSGLELGKTYTFRIKAYKEYRGKRVSSDYSKPKKIKMENAIYLLNRYKPYNDSYYTEYKKGKSFKMGGENQTNGFTLGQDEWGVEKRAVFNIQGRYTKLSFKVGKIDNASNHPYDGDLDVNIYADGVLIKTIVVEVEALPQSVNVDIQNAKQLKFEVEEDACTIVGFSNVKLNFK